MVSVADFIPNRGCPIETTPFTGGILGNKRYDELQQSNIMSVFFVFVCFISFFQRCINIAPPT